MATVPILPGLSVLAGRYDALICDVWGVLHNGVSAHQAAVEALRRFRAEFGPVVLLSNAPRPAHEVKAQFARYGVPEDCYDAIMTSGMATRDDLARRAAAGPVKMLHLGPERDRGVFEGLDVILADPDAAELILCTGLYDDDTETPEDYRALFERLVPRGLKLLCANPDILVQRGADLIYCAGALAQLYEEMGGKAIYYGKPHAPIYRETLALAERLAGRPIARPLAVGDGLKTDIAGANAFGLDVLFIADGVHAAELGGLSEAAVTKLFAERDATAVGAMAALMW